MDLIACCMLDEADLRLPANKRGSGLVRVPGRRACRIRLAGRTIEHHRAQIRAERGFREATGDDEPWIVERP